VKSGIMLITGMDQRTISAAEQYARSREPEHAGLAAEAVRA
jgi:hypothetical protein